MAPMAYLFRLRDDVDSDRVVVSVQGVDLVFGANSDADHAASEDEYQPAVAVTDVYETDDADQADLLAAVPVLEQSVEVDGVEYDPDSVELRELLAAASDADQAARAEDTQVAVDDRQEAVAEARVFDSAPDGNVLGDTSAAGDTTTEVAE